MASPVIIWLNNQSVKSHGLRDCRAGKNGGIRLGKPAGQIRVGDVVRDLEPLSLVNCSSEFCHITPACRLKQALAEAAQSFLKELDNYTLADLVEKNQPLYKLLLVE